MQVWKHGKEIILHSIYSSQQNILYHKTFTATHVLLYDCDFATVYTFLKASANKDILNKKFVPFSLKFQKPTVQKRCLPGK